MKTFTLSLPRETVPEAHTHRGTGEITLALEQRGGNICVPMLCRKTVHRRGERREGQEWCGLLQACAHLEQMENVSITGDVSTL